MQVEDVLNANTHTQHERRLRIVRATEKEDEWNKADKEEGKAGSGSSDEEGKVRTKYHVQLLRHGTEAVRYQS